MAFLSYFPATATVHPGDSVTFKLAADTGEPHTVTLGTLADTAVKAVLADPDPNNPGATATAADAAVPNLLPQGPGDAAQAAAAPCFLPSGPVTTATVCLDAQQQQPATFKGTEAYFNSGWMTPTSTFTVKLDPNIAPRDLPVHVPGAPGIAVRAGRCCALLAERAVCCHAGGAGPG